jgi:hypothetical protein
LNIVLAFGVSGNYVIGEDLDMKNAFVFLVLTMHTVMLSQDSISIEFARLYNQFRKDNQLQPVEYSLELEKFAHERLRVSIEGTKECYTFGNWEDQCPTKNMHFKFIPMGLNHNENSEMEIDVVTENMALHGEFTYSETPINSKPKKTILTKIEAFFDSLFDSEKDITIQYSKTSNNKNLYEYKIVSFDPIKETHIANVFFQDWVGSQGHKRNFMIKDLTHFAFAFCRTQKNGAPYIQAVWIGGKKKQR